MIRYCLPLMTDNEALLIETIQTSGQEYDFFEVWLDYLDGAGPDTCARLASIAGDEKLIFLFRRQNLEAIRMNINRRIEIMRWLDKRSSYLDLDISSQKEEISLLKSEGLRVNTIISYHNYTSTPAEEKLRSILDEMCDLKASIVKIATLCRSPRDALLLLKLELELAERGQKHIILGMGEHGKATRIFGTLWGNQMIFAPRDLASGSAPGQLSRNQLEKIFAELK